MKINRISLCLFLSLFFVISNVNSQSKKEVPKRTKYKYTDLTTCLQFFGQSLEENYHFSEETNMIKQKHNLICSNQDQTDCASIDRFKKAFDNKFIGIQKLEESKLKHSASLYTWARDACKTVWGEQMDTYLNDRNIRVPPQPTSTKVKSPLNMGGVDSLKVNEEPKVIK